MIFVLIGFKTKIMSLVKIKKGSLKKEVSKEKFQKVYSQYGWAEELEKPKPMPKKTETKKEKETEPKPSPKTEEK